MKTAEPFLEHRSRIFAIAYRMLGTVQDAEDVVQEAFLRWSRVEASDVRSPRDYLAATVTRLCLDHLRTLQARRAEYVGLWLPEPLAGEGADPLDEALAKDSLSTSFLLLLERLSPLERAVLLLRDVFGYEYAQIAEFVDKSEDNCRQLLHRARQHVAQDRARYKPEQAMSLSLTQRFVEACFKRDMDSLLAVLTEDVTACTDGGGKVKALPRAIRGAAAVARFMLAASQNASYYDELRVGEVNGGPGLISIKDGKVSGVASFAFDDDRISFAFDDDRISGVYVVVNPEKLTGNWIGTTMPFELP